mmetsp:Transcript_49545/g.97564  ORF Transcript_49545/g.97564 Transcript_49545/m.97564 type:complete len:225 (-) Transcript_49545:400-1074(-)
MFLCSGIRRGWRESDMPSGLSPSSPALWTKRLHRHQRSVDNTTAEDRPKIAYITLSNICRRGFGGPSGTSAASDGDNPLSEDSEGLSLSPSFSSGISITSPSGCSSPAGIEIVSSSSPSPSSEVPPSPSPPPPDGVEGSSEGAGEGGASVGPCASSVSFAGGEPSPVSVASTGTAAAVAGTATPPAPFPLRAAVSFPARRRISSAMRCHRGLPHPVVTSQPGDA